MSLWIYWVSDNENKARTHCAQLRAPCSSASPSCTSFISKVSPVEEVGLGKTPWEKVDIQTKFCHEHALFPTKFAKKALLGGFYY